MFSHELFLAALPTWKHTFYGLSMKCDFIIEIEGCIKGWRFVAQWLSVLAATAETHGHVPIT